jgi:hypothetical protein
MQKFKKIYLLAYFIFQFQKLFFFLSFYFFKLFQLEKKSSWGIGVDEIASYLTYLQQNIPKSVSICLRKNKSYSHNYTFSFYPKNSKLEFLLKTFFGPFILGYLANRYDSFFYIGSKGFLFEGIDGRDFELSQLKKMKKKIVTCFLGSDIRSHTKLLEIGLELQRDVITTYQTLVVNDLGSKDTENLRKKLAYSAEKNSNVVFNFPVDQTSYLEKKCEPFIYLYPDENFFKNTDKFNNTEKIKILHAPSSPIIKGTPLVRAAIKRLATEGYNFEYKELINVSHEIVLKELRNSHIVLNQFYAFVPGFFGVEALSSYCAVLMSADRNIEKTLPPESNQAWLVTSYFEIYDNLKRLLDTPPLIHSFANKGYEWALNHASYSISGKKLNNILKEI